MPKRKSKTKEEILARKRELERKRYEKIKNNPDLYAKYKERNKEKYEKRKKEGKVTSIDKLPARDQRMLRKKWREDAKKSYQRKKEAKARIQLFLECNSPPSSDIENINPENIGGSNGNYPESLGKSECGRITRSYLRSRDVSPASSYVSSVNSAEIVSPSAQRLVRKLRYKKDKEIASLRLQLQSVKKVNDAFRKKLSRLQSLNANIYDPALPGTSRDDSTEEALLQSYKNEKSYKIKQIISASLQQQFKSAKLHRKFKTMFRKRDLPKKQSVLKKKKDVKTFLSDDENSSCTAGKKEYVKKEGIKVQKRYLNDSLGNLHKKFNSSQPYILSFATFCRFRPFWILPASKRPKEMCLCVIHENFQLIVSALHKHQIIAPKDATNLLKTICCNVYNARCLFRDCINCNDNVIQYLVYDDATDFYYWSWNSKTETIVQNGCNKTIRLVKKEKMKTKPKEAIKLFEDMIDKYMKHCGRMVSQQEAIKEIKEQLKPEEAVIHVDYSENYKCSYAKEIQSAHFGASKPQITIHTSVLYFFDVNMQKQTQCFATFSPNLRHDTAAVWAHMDPIIDYLKAHSPQITTFHIVSDSATSQYRNYKIYYVITALRWNYPQLKCVTWNYSESGHGKGAPDGVGAVIKRTADSCVNHGADVPDFESFSRLLTQNLKNVVTETVSDYKIFEKDLLLPDKLQPFKGTQQVHQIVWCNSRSTSVVLRRLSCTKETCLTEAEYCKHGKHLGFHNVLVSTPKPKRKKTKESSMKQTPRHVKTRLDFFDVSDDNDEFVAPETDLSVPVDDISVTTLHRSTPFSALSEIELPSELRRSTLDNILSQNVADFSDDEIF
ncbi:uncharacterized protein LOC113497006 [Trichoplusia ni]|uniref:Uncharacterized protein LOC113491650 n=1 Tax=Trichoplusia ni TaxID=7111 RepID=A0A7E5V8B2_TRINI|nr:uncharacterized protein LOC113491650 [Trichoplusia ni]XP_026732237.1 uncharacterized protein LOC113497006 [Trichoplusia ni]